MARSLNSVILSGYLGSEPRYHQFEDGNEVCNLSVAVNRQRKNQQTGEWEDDPLWVEVKVFGAQATVCQAYLTKGSFVIVQGQLAAPRLWQDDGGNQRVSLVVDRAHVTFGPKTGEGNGGGSPQQQAAPAAAPAASRLGADDDSIPF